MSERRGFLSLRVGPVSLTKQVHERGPGGEEIL